MEVMVIYVWPCMVILLYDCICAWWLWPIVNEDATSTINPLRAKFIIRALHSVLK